MGRSGVNFTNKSKQFSIFLNTVFMKVRYFKKLSDSIKNDRLDLHYFENRGKLAAFVIKNKTSLFSKYTSLLRDKPERS